MPCKSEGSVLLLQRSGVANLCTLPNYTYVQALIDCVNFTVFIIGQDRHRHLVNVNVIVIKMMMSVVGHGLKTPTQKMDMDHQGSVGGRGLMGDSASSGLAGEFAGRVAAHCD